MTEMLAYDIYLVSVMWGHTVDSRYYEGSDQKGYMTHEAARNALKRRINTDEVICRICAQQEPEVQTEDVFVLSGENGWVQANITTCPLFVQVSCIRSREITPIPHFADLLKLYPVTDRNR